MLMVKIYLTSLVLYLIYTFWFKYIYLSLHDEEYSRYLSAPRATDETRKVGNVLAIYGLFTIIMVIWTIVTIVMCVWSL